MEIVLGFFDTDRFKELCAEGKLRYGYWMGDMENILMLDNGAGYKSVYEIPIMHKILLAMHLCDEIHFICDDLDLAYQQPNEWSGIYTMTEYYAIISTTSFSEKTIFYGRPINPDAQMHIKEQVVEDIAAFKNRYNIQ